MLRIYKAKTKRWHYKKITEKHIEPGHQVLLYNSRLKLFPDKLKSRWSGPYRVVEVFPYGAVEVIDSLGKMFKVNGQRLKHYWVGEIDHRQFSISLGNT